MVKYGCLSVKLTHVKQARRLFHRQVVRFRVWVGLSFALQEIYWTKMKLFDETTVFRTSYRPIDDALINTMQVWVVCIPCQF